MTAPVALFGTTPGPLGPVHLAATERGIVAIELFSPTDEFVARLERRLGDRVAAAEATGNDRGRPSEAPGPAGDHLEAGLGAVRAFLACHPAAFEGLALDLGDRPAWDRAVLGAVRAISWGEVSSYGEIARVIGRPGAARAVGGAVGRNPVSLAIPCHRVIAGDGTLGGYGGGWWGSREVRLELKRSLLSKEGNRVPDRVAGGSVAR